MAELSEARKHVMTCPRCNGSRREPGWRPGETDRYCMLCAGHGTITVRRAALAAAEGEGAERG